MSLRGVCILSLLLVSLAENEPNAAAENVPMPNAQPMKVPANDTSTWSNFVYCKCGISCAEQLGSWYLFDMGQSCMCSACPGEDAGTAALRGKGQGEVPPLKAEDVKENKRKSLESAASEESWEAASVRGSNLLYCRCGKGCAYGRQLGLWTYYCFRYGCKPCPGQ